MPRQVSLQKKIEWTELAEGGLSVAEIRAQDKRKPDPRTITRAIEQVRGQRRRGLAREVALEEGLREHWRLLLYKLDLLPSSDFVWTDFDKNPAYALSASRLSGQGWSAKRDQSDWTVGLNFESAIEAKLLREHLPTDVFWSLITTFKRDLGGALKARLALAKALIDSVEDSSALEVTKEESTPGLTLAGLSRLDRYMEVRALKDSPSSLALKVEDGAVWFQDTLVATPSGSTAESLKAVIEKSVNGLRGKDAWKGLLLASARIERTAGNLADETAVLKLSTVLPGECRSCARYSV